jgi:adenylate kinase family enzyme
MPNMNRISVVGSSGSGKTTLARAIAGTLGIPHLELDSLYHQANWQPLPGDEFVARVRRFVEQPRWVVDGNYSSHGVLDVVWQGADTVVWLDPPRRTVMWRVLLRTLRRVAMGTELWNGNRERWGNLWNTEPEQNVMLWAFTRFEHIRTRYEARTREPRFAHLAVHRLRTDPERERLLAALRR